MAEAHKLSSLTMIYPFLFQSLENNNKLRITVKLVAWSKFYFQNEIKYNIQAWPDSTNFLSSKSFSYLWEKDIFELDQVPMPSSKEIFSTRLPKHWGPHIAMIMQKSQQLLLNTTPLC